MNNKRAIRWFSMMLMTALLLTTLLSLPSLHVSPVLFAKVV